MDSWAGVGSIVAWGWHFPDAAEELFSFEDIDFK